MLLAVFELPEVGAREAFGIQPAYCDAFDSDY